MNKAPKVFIYYNLLFFNTIYFSRDKKNNKASIIYRKE